MSPVDPRDRAQAARLLLDAVASLDPTDCGTPGADIRLLVAVEPLGLDVDDARTAATLAATVDMLSYLLALEAQHSGTSIEFVIANLAQKVLPRVYPQAYRGEQAGVPLDETAAG